MANVHAVDPTVSESDAIPQPGDTSIKAAELEEWARENPDDPEAAGVLLDAGCGWAAAGQHERALALFQQIQAEGGDRAGVAGGYVAQELFALGRDDEALAVVTGLRVALDAVGRPDGDAYAVLADLFAERGETEEALRWFEVGIARYCPNYRSDTASADDFDAVAAHLTSGRRMLREQLGLPADELDRAVDAAGERTLRMLTKFASAMRDDAPGRVRRKAAAAMSLYWSESDFVVVRTRWPRITEDYGEDYRSYCRRVEGSTRELSEQGHVQVLLVRESLADYERYAQRTGQNPGEPVTRQEYGRWRAKGDSLRESVAWPPARNDRCWCGSGAKYKKCCGSVASR